MHSFRIIASILAIACVLDTKANAQSQSLWTGGNSFGSNWSSAQNWDLVNGTQPSNSGSSQLVYDFSKLVFAHVPPNYNSDNDRTGFTAIGIDFKSTNLATGAVAFDLTGNQITLGGNITATGNGGAPMHSIGMGLVFSGDRTITTATDGNITISGAINESGGSRSLIKNGEGTLILAGANSLSGGIVVNGGNLQVGNGGTTGSLGSGSVIVNTAMTFNRSDAAGTFSNTIGGSGTVTKAGSGTITLTGNNSYSGATTVSNGVLNIQHANALGSTAGGTTVSSGAVLQIQGGITTAAEGLTLNGTGITSSGALQNVSGNNTYTGAITLGSATQINAASNSTLTLDVASGSAISGTNQNVTFGGAGNITVADSISIGTGSLTKLGSGTLTLATANSYSGGTTWGNPQSQSAAGVLSLGNNAALGTGTLTVRNSGTSGDWIQSSNSTARTISNNVVLAGGSINFATGGTADLTFSGNVDLGGDAATTRTFTVGNQQTTFSGIISSNASISKGGAGTMILSGANTYNGSTTVSAGALNIQHANALGSTTNGTTVNSGAALQIQGGITTAAEGLNLNGSGISNTGALRNISSDNIYAGAISLGSATRINSDAGTLTLSGGISGTQNLTVGGNGNTAISGVIATGTGSLTKDGAGTLILSGNNTYTGTTTVNAGTLRVNGSISTGNVTIASGATLGGSGTIGGATTISGIHSPGNSPGLQTFNGGLTYLNGSSLTWELVDNTVGGRGTLFDAIDVTGGTLTINSGVTSNLVFNGSGSLVDWNNVFWAISRQWLVYDNANPPSLGSPIFTTINVSNDSNNASLGSIRDGSFFSWSRVGNDIFLNYNFASAAVPEPGTFGLMGLAGLIGVLRHRRRRKEMSQV